VALEPPRKQEQAKRSEELQPGDAGVLGTALWTSCQKRVRRLQLPTYALDCTAFSATLPTLSRKGKGKCASSFVPSNPLVNRGDGRALELDPSQPVVENRGNVKKRDY